MLSRHACFNEVKDSSYLEKFYGERPASPNLQRRLRLPLPAHQGPAGRWKVSFNAAREEAKIPDFRFHDLRHTAATRMVAGGADAFTLAAIFGWSDIRMPLRYTHATGEAVRRAVENLAGNEESGDKTVTKEKRQAGTPALTS